MQRSLLIRASAAILFAATTSLAQASAVLLGAGTLDTSNDLTVISTGSSNLEFLDLSVTDNMSIAGAVAAYSGYGFRWANEAEVANLFAAFGIVYGSGSGFRDLGASLASSTNFVDYLGVTNGLGSSLGWIADDTPVSGNSYSCISIYAGLGDCPYSFLVKDSSFSDPSSSVGVFLVRDAGGTVPEPGTLALAGLSLACYLSALRRKV